MGKLQLIRGKSHYQFLRQLLFVAAAICMIFPGIVLGVALGGESAALAAIGVIGALLTLVPVVPALAMIGVGIAILDIADCVVARSPDPDSRSPALPPAIPKPVPPALPKKGNRTFKKGTKPQPFSVCCPSCFADFDCDEDPSGVDFDCPDCGHNFKA